eukprot:1840760-Rhodomonas_salina.1
MGDTRGCERGVERGSGFEGVALGVALPAFRLAFSTNKAPGYIIRLTRDGDGERDKDRQRETSRERERETSVYAVLA